MRSIHPADLLRLFASILAIALAAILQRPDRSQRSTFGDAKFASRKDVRAIGLHGGEGIVVGKHGRRHLFFGGQQFVLVSAPTRSGKGVGIVIPNLLTFTGSVVVLDIKGENFAKTSGFRSKSGQQVFRFCPFSSNSTCYNPLEALSSNPDHRFGEVMALAESIYPTSHDNPFWNEQAANLFVGLVLYLCERPELPRTFTQLLKLLTDADSKDPRRVAARLSANSDYQHRLSEACTGALLRFASNSEAASAGIVSSFYAPLLVFSDPMVAKATSTSDFDLAELRRQPMSIYVCIEPQHLKSARVVLNLFFTQLIFQNTQALPDRLTPRLQCLIVMDEFTSIGRIDILAHSIAFMAGYNLRLLTIVQSLTQLSATYGESDARTLVANHGLRIVFAPSELRDARDVSEMLGNTTLRTQQETRNQARGGGGRHSISRRLHEQARPLLLPQELRTLGADQELILIHGRPPILAEKIRYFDDAVLAERAALGSTI